VNPASGEGSDNVIACRNEMNVWNWHARSWSSSTRDTAGSPGDQIATRHPDFGAAEVARSATIAVTSGAVFHGVLLALCALLVWKLATARPWTRRLATASQLLSVVFSVVSWSSSPMFHTVIPIICAAQILTVALLWFPSTARESFAKRFRSPCLS
jgi:hypothetical protein